MAQRPIFVPEPGPGRPVRTEPVEFTWHAGLAIPRKRLSISSLHDAARVLLGLEPVLEVSTRSTNRLGVTLSAFNLLVQLPKSASFIPVECAFQASKVFERGGPFTDLQRRAPADAKRDTRLRSSGRLVCFRFGDLTWSPEPRTAFYDWLYLTALCSRPDLLARLQEYRAFTDIEFNPQRSFACQAYSVALGSALHRRGRLSQALSGQDAFLDAVYGKEHEESRSEPSAQLQLL